MTGFPVLQFANAGVKFGNLAINVAQGNYGYSYYIGDLIEGEDELVTPDREDRYVTPEENNRRTNQFMYMDTPGTHRFLKPNSANIGESPDNLKIIPQAPLSFRRRPSL